MKMLRISSQLVGQNLTNGTSPKPWGPWVLHMQGLQLDPCSRVTVVWQRKMGFFSSCLDFRTHWVLCRKLAQV